MSLSLDGVDLVHADGQRALADIRLRLAAGERVALIGPSGAGKTSLLRVLASQWQPSAGRVELLGEEPWALSAAARQRLRARIGLVHQAPPLPPRQRVASAVLAGRLGQWPLWKSLASLVYPLDRAGAHDALQRLDLGDKLFQRCDQLSGGQLQRVGIARVLYQRAELILADEPVSAMDPVLAGHTLALLNREAAARGSTLLASLHAVELALQHFPPGDRPARRTHRLRPARRRSRPRRAGRPLRQRTTASRARQPGQRTRRGAHPTMLNAASPPRDPAALPRLLLTLAALLLLWPGLRLSELDIPGLFSGDNARTMGGFLAGFWPPAHDPEFLALLGRATLETLAIATAGMALAWLLAFPAALLATRALSLSALPRGGLPAWWARALRWPVRGLLILLRSVPEIVWALLFVRAVGLGPTAGVLAIAITYAGMLGKVYAEIFESVDPRPTRALLLGGGSRLAAFAYGVLPNAAGEMISYTVYRWECAIRASVVMGFVGAGGLGQQIDLSLRMFAGGEVASILLTFLLLVLLADLLSRFLRGRLA